MAWADIKTAIISAVTGVSVTAPAAKSIARVYPNPPGAVQDVPCIIVYPPAETVVRHPSLKSRTYIVRLRLLIMDEDMAEAADFVDSFRDAVIDAFDAHQTLGGKADAISGPDAQEAADFKYGERSYTGMDFLLTVHVQEAATYSA